jgi:DNA-binding CsgD family transcriptional regulator
MSKNLQNLIQKIAAVRDEKALRLVYMDAAGELFSAPHWSICMQERQGKVPKNQGTIDLKGLPDSFVDYYAAVGAEIDPVMDYVITNHAPVHEQVIFTEETWKKTKLYRGDCGQKYHHEHIMTAALVGRGQMIGSLHFARTRDSKAFDTQDLMHLSVLCTHISAQLEFMRTIDVMEAACSQSNLLKNVESLTRRELQIAQLVANGLKNHEIATELWISPNTVKETLKRVFRKLDVSSRAEMVAKLLVSPMKG